MEPLFIRTKWKNVIEKIFGSMALKEVSSSIAFTY